MQIKFIHTVRFRYLNVPPYKAELPQIVQTAQDPGVGIFNFNRSGAASAAPLLLAVDWLGWICYFSSYCMCLLDYIQDFFGPCFLFACMAGICLLVEIKIQLAIPTLEMQHCSTSRTSVWERYILKVKIDIPLVILWPDLMSSCSTGQNIS